MRRTVQTVGIVVMVLSLFGVASATCGNTTVQGAESNVGTACVNDQFLKRITYRPYWQDGFNKYLSVPDQGVSNWTDPSCHTNGCPCLQGCWPIFYAPFFEESGTGATWVEGTRAATIDNGICSNTALTWRHEWYHDCGAPINRTNRRSRNL